MKNCISLLCLSLCLILVLLPAADAACNRTYPGGVIPTTYYSPGPYGTIYIESSPPGAVIYINDQNQGHAPATVTGLWPGSYIIRAELAGYQEYSTTTTISGPFRSSVYCPLVPESSGNGLYILSTPSDADVFLDGVHKGKTPLMQRDTPAGSHSVLVRLSGYADWKSDVVAPVGGTKTVSAILVETGTDLNQGLNISSVPAGARIILDGREKGITQKTLNTLAPGIHVLELEYPGYTSWKSTVDVPETGIKEISINLIPNASCAPGGITVHSTPGNASVTLDGNYVGRTLEGNSLDMENIPPGDYTLLLALPGYKSYSTRVTVSPNLISAVNATLIPVSGPFARGALTVYSDPSGATILVDNESIGVSPLSAPDISAGDHQITIQMKGYQEYTVNILVAAGTTRNISATLIPSKSSLHSPLFSLTAIGAFGIAGFFILRKYH